MNARLFDRVNGFEFASDLEPSHDSEILPPTRRPCSPPPCSARRNCCAPAKSWRCRRKPSMAWPPMRSMRKPSRAIYEVKGRPAHNPIIVHVAGVEMAKRCVTHWPAAARKLAKAFWPGPLTLVLPRAKRIPDLVTAGGPTVGVRWPSHPFIQAVIRECGFPLAAPERELVEPGFAHQRRARAPAARRQDRTHRGWRTLPGGHRVDGAGSDGVAATRAATGNDS